MKSPTTYSRGLLQITPRNPGRFGKFYSPEDTQQMRGGADNAGQKVKDEGLLVIAKGHIFCSVNPHAESVGETTEKPPRGPGDQGDRRPSSQESRFEALLSCQPTELSR